MSKSFNMLCFRILFFIGGLAFLGIYDARAEEINLRPEGLASFDLATYCQGKPETAKWIIYEDSPPTFSKNVNACYLPWANSPSNDPPQWIDLDLRGIGQPPCSEQRKSFLQQQSQQPKFFYLRVYKSNMASKRKVSLAVRSMQGVEEDGGWKEKGWTQWSPLTGRELGQEAVVLQIPFSQVALKSQHHVQVKIQLFSNNKLTEEKIINLLWPLNC